MDRNEKIKERLELALRPAEEPPTLEDALEQVSTHGVLRGPVDWVFPAWMLYVEYAVQRIAETFPLSEEEKRQLLHFRDTLKRLLREAWMQAKKKLTTLHKAVAEGTYRIEGKRLYAQDANLSVWTKTDRPIIFITGVGAVTYFPDVLKLPNYMYKLIQLGWRASDESEMSLRPAMGTTQPWQLIAWTSVRFGRVWIRIDAVNLTSDGATINVVTRANDWEKPPKKGEAIKRVVEYFKQGEWLPLLAMWLGDGINTRFNAIRGIYHIMMAIKEPEMVGKPCGKHQALVVTGKDSYIKLANSAGRYGVLLDILEPHKWVTLKLANDEFKTKFLLRQKGLSYLPDSLVKIGDIPMRIHVVYGRGSDSLTLRYSTKAYDEAVEVASKLEKMGLRPNIIRAGPYFVVYIATLDVLQLATTDESLRKKIADYLAFKAKYGTEKQRFVIARLLRKYPIFSNPGLPVMSTFPALTSTAYVTPFSSVASMSTSPISTPFRYVL
jgi:hypothetical protein